MYQMSLEMKKKMLKIKCGAECIESMKCSQRGVKEKKKNPVCPMQEWGEMSLPGYEIALPNKHELLLHLRRMCNQSVSWLCSLSTTNLIIKEPKTNDFKIYNCSS